MKKLQKLLSRNIHLLFLFLWCPSVFAQHEAGPYQFSPYVGNLIWEDTDESTVNYKLVSMDKPQALTNGQDGLIACFNIHLKPNVDQLAPIVALSADGANSNNILEIIYSKNTVMIRRYATINGVRKSYDYDLFDPLFQFTAEKTFEFRLYFTSNFMYLVSKDIAINPGYLMSPLYFGLDYINKYPSSSSFMYKFLNRNNQAVIKIGDQSQKHLPYISDVKIYGFNYEDWAKQMQSGFSSPNPAILTN